MFKEMFLQIFSESNEDISDSQLVMINRLIIVSLLVISAICMVIVILMYRQKRRISSIGKISSGKKGFILLGQESDESDAEECETIHVKVNSDENDFDKAFENFHLSSFKD